MSPDVAPLRDRNPYGFAWVCISGFFCLLFFHVGFERWRRVFKFFFFFWCVLRLFCLLWRFFCWPLDLCFICFRGPYEEGGIGVEQAHK